MVAAAVLILGSVGVAQAVPYTWTDEIGPLDRTITASLPYTYTHDIKDGAYGYRPGVDTISNASLSIWLYDDSFFGDLPIVGDGEETVAFRLDNGVWTSASVDSLFYSLDRFDFTVTSLVSDGLLNVTVRANRGDFGFAGSLLTVSGNRASTSVPEPGTLTLFGLGLLATGFAARRRRNR